eukprot:scaffold58109_cov75-Phaeocystis_antarctica.AAC.2
MTMRDRWKVRALDGPGETWGIDANHATRDHVCVTRGRGRGRVWACGRRVHVFHLKDRVVRSLQVHERRVPWPLWRRLIRADHDDHAAGLRRSRGDRPLRRRWEGKRCSRRPQTPCATRARAAFLWVLLGPAAVGPLAARRPRRRERSWSCGLPDEPLDPWVGRPPSPALPLRSPLVLPRRRLLCICRSISDSVFSVGRTLVHDRLGRHQQLLLRAFAGDGIEVWRHFRARCRKPWQAELRKYTGTLQRNPRCSNVGSTKHHTPLHDSMICHFAMERYRTKRNNGYSMMCTA